MLSTYLRGLILFALLAGMTLSLGAAPKDDKRPSPPAAKEERSSPFEIPNGSILAVFDSIADALMSSPNSVVLTRKQYQSMKDELDRLRQMLGRPRLLAPSRSSIKGKVDGDVVRLAVEFEFETQQDNALVRLACGQAIATDARLEGHTPRLRPPTPRAGPAAGAATFPPSTEKARPGRPEDAGESDSFVVEIDRPGRHALNLELLLPVTSASGGYGFTLGLPRTAVTRLELELPPGARDVRLGGKTAAEALLDRKNNLLSGNLGAADRLDLTWRPAQAVAASPTLIAEGTVSVHVGAKQVTTDARLTLSAQSGQTRQWQVLVPATAQLRVEKPAPGENGGVPAEEPRVEKAAKNLLTQYTIHLKEASAEPVTVVIEHTQPAPEPGGRKGASVGPFIVLGAAQHKGSVLVSNAVPDWHLEFTPKGDVSRRAVSDEELRNNPRLFAAFRYGPGIGKDEGGRMKDEKSRPGAPPSSFILHPSSFSSRSWLDIDVTAVGGQAKVQADHKLTPASDTGDGRGWQVRSTFTVTPRRADVDRFRVLLPEGCDYNPADSQAPSDLVGKVFFDGKSRVVEFRLNPASSGAVKDFKVDVVAGYAVAGPDEKAPDLARFALPRPTNAIEQGGTITAEAPGNLEVLPPEGPGAPGLDLVAQTPQKLEWRYPRRAPDSVALRWRPYRPPVRVTSEVNVTLHPGDAHVVHDLRYQLPPSAGRRLTLRVPPAVGTSLKVVKGGELGPMSTAADGWQTASVSAADQNNPALRLSYDCPLPNGRNGSSPTTLSVPLVVPEQTTSGETRVRMWCDAGQLPSPGRGWAEQNIEVVPGENRLPVLVMHSDRVDRPLTVRMGHSEPILTALIERALVRVQVDANGTQDYRIRYRLTRLAGRRLDLELPGPRLSINFTASLDGVDITPEDLGGEMEGRRVGLRLSPELVGRPAVLEVRYLLTAHRLGGTALLTPLQGPRLLGEPAEVPTRWQISTPPAWVLLGPQGDLSVPRQWGRRGWLLAPRSGLSAADLELWFAGDRTPAAADVAPDLVLWHDSFATVQLVHVQQLTWLLLCSLGLVLLGLALSRLPLVTGEERSPAWAWALLLGLLLAVGLLAVLWPGLAGQLAYGCQPGAAVLALAALVQWLLHERYRRQIVFLPSFSRSRSGSSLLRRQPAEAEPLAEGPVRGHGEPSTVDVPRATGSRSGPAAPSGGSRRPVEAPDAFPLSPQERQAEEGYPPFRGPAGSST